MKCVPVTVLADLLIHHNETMPTHHVEQELRLALLGAGYPEDAVEVTQVDAVAILERLDAGIVKSTPQQRAAFGPPFGHGRLRTAPRPPEGARG